MRHYIKLLALLVLLCTTIYAAPAKGGVRTFEQADGTTFSGILKGDASFHWIESHSKVVLFNPQDKFYYYAKIGKDGKLKRTDAKVEVSQERPSARRSFTREEIHSVTPSMHRALMELMQTAKKGNHPR